MKAFSKFLTLFLVAFTLAGTLFAVEPAPHPNPWRFGENNSANGGIDFNIRTDAVKAELSIYNLNGDRVRLVKVTDLALLSTGVVTWNGQNENGWLVAGGVYFYALTVTFPTGTGTDEETYKGKFVFID